MKKHLLFLGFMLFVTHYGLAQNEKFKALFMYNFAKNINWPSSQNNGEFVIAVVGSSPIIDELKIISTKQKIGSQTIVVKQIKSAEELNEAKIVYIPTSQSQALKDVVEHSTGKNILIVTDKDGLAKEGAGINYVKDGERIKYEINKANIEKRGLIVNSALVSLGIPVNQ